MRFMLFKGKGYKILPIILITTISISIVVLILSGLFLQRPFFNASSVLLFIVLILYLGIYFGLPKISYKKVKSVFPDETFYRFYDEHLEVVALGDIVKGIDTLKYKVFSKIYEVDSAFYLMMTNGTSMILTKQTMEAGAINYLSGFLAYRFGDKYKNCF